MKNICSEFEQNQMSGFFSAAILGSGVGVKRVPKGQKIRRKNGGKENFRNFFAFRSFPNSLGTSQFILDKNGDGLMMADS